MAASDNYIFRAPSYGPINSLGELLGDKLSCPPLYNDKMNN